MKNWMSVLENPDKRPFGYPMYDHPRRGHDKYILQCYPCTKEHFKKLIEFCDQYDLDFIVRSQSAHSIECFTVEIGKKI